MNNTNGLGILVLLGLGVFLFANRKQTTVPTPVDGTPPPIPLFSIGSKVKYTTNTFGYAIPFIFHGEVTDMFLPTGAEWHYFVVFEEGQFGNPDYPYAFTSDGWIPESQLSAR